VYLIKKRNTTSIVDRFVGNLVANSIFKQNLQALTVQVAQPMVPQLPIQQMINPIDLR
jgi:hypothetical protein